MAQNTTAPPLRGNSDFWSLTIGPEASNWSRILVCSHLDSSTRLALFSTCKAARDMMLVTADQAHVRLRDRQHEPTSDIIGMVAATKGLLQTRGKLRTKLGLTGADAWTSAYMLGMLTGSITWLYQLRLLVSYNGPPRQQLPTTILCTIARCCPNLRVLQVWSIFLDNTIREMPSPALFPKLEELSITVTEDPEEQAFASETITPYLPQLTSLTLRVAENPHRAAPSTDDEDDDGAPPPRTHLPLLHTPGNAAGRLHTLGLPQCSLTDTLLGLLLQCTPALEQLDVRGIRLASDMHAQAQVRWKSLSVNGLVHVNGLTRLPVAPALEVTVLGADGEDEPTLVCDMSGSRAKVFDGRLKGVLCDAYPSGLSITPGPHVHLEDQCAVLRLALSLLHTSSAPGTHNSRISLDGWTMTSDILQELPHLPPWERVDFGIEDLVWLPDPHMYSTLLRLLPDSFKTVHLYADGLTNGQVESICLGAPGDRTPEACQSLRIVTYRGREDLVQAIKHKIQQGMFPNVTVA